MRRAGTEDITCSGCGKRDVATATSRRRTTHYYTMPPGWWSISDNHYYWYGLGVLSYDGLYCPDCVPSHNAQGTCACGAPLHVSTFRWSIGIGTGPHSDSTGLSLICLKPECEKLRRALSEMED